VLFEILNEIFLTASKQNVHLVIFEQLRALNENLKSKFTEIELKIYESILNANSSQFIEGLEQYIATSINISNCNQFLEYIDNDGELFIRYISQILELAQATKTLNIFTNEIIFVGQGNDLETLSYSDFIRRLQNPNQVYFRGDWFEMINNSSVDFIVNRLIPANILQSYNTVMTKSYCISNINLIPSEISLEFSRMGIGIVYVEEELYIIKHLKFLTESQLLQEQVTTNSNVLLLNDIGVYVGVHLVSNFNTDGFSIFENVDGRLTHSTFFPFSHGTSKLLEGIKLTTSSGRKKFLLRITSRFKQISDFLEKSKKKNFSSSTEQNIYFHLAVNKIMREKDLKMKIAKFNSLINEMGPDYKNLEKARYRLKEAYQQIFVQSTEQDNINIFWNYFARAISANIYSDLAEFTNYLYPILKYKQFSFQTTMKILRAIVAEFDVSDVEITEKYKEIYKFAISKFFIANIDVKNFDFEKSIRMMKNYVIPEFEEITNNSFTMIVDNYRAYCLGVFNQRVIVNSDEFLNFSTQLFTTFINIDVIDLKMNLFTKINEIFNMIDTFWLLHFLGQNSIKFLKILGELKSDAMVIFESFLSRYLQVIIRRLGNSEYGNHYSSGKILWLMYEKFLPVQDIYRYHSLWLESLILGKSLLNVGEDEFHDFSDYMDRLYLWMSSNSKLVKMNGPLEESIKEFVKFYFSENSLNLSYSNKILFIEKWTKRIPSLEKISSVIYIRLKLLYSFEILFEKSIEQSIDELHIINKNELGLEVIFIQNIVSKYLSSEEIYKLVDLTNVLTWILKIDKMIGLTNTEFTSFVSGIVDKIQELIIKEIFDGNITQYEELIRKLDVLVLILPSNSLEVQLEEFVSINVNDPFQLNRLINYNQFIQVSTDFFGKMATRRPPAWIKKIQYSTLKKSEIESFIQEISTRSKQIVDNSMILVKNAVENNILNVELLKTFFSIVFNALSRTEIFEFSILENFIVYSLIEWSSRSYTLSKLIKLIKSNAKSIKGVVKKKITLFVKELEKLTEFQDNYQNVVRSSHEELLDYYSMSQALNESYLTINNNDFKLFTTLIMIKEYSHALEIGEKFLITHDSSGSQYSRALNNYLYVANKLKKYSKIKEMLDYVNPGILHTVGSTLRLLPEKSLPQWLFEEINVDRNILELFS